MQKNTTENPSRKIAFCAMMAALGVVIMLSGGLIPVFTYCSPLVASLLLIAVLDEYGKKYACMVWAVTGVLSLIIGVDKEASFFYLFFAWYPIEKPLFDRIRPAAVQTAIKAGVFAAATGIMYGLICYVFQIGEIIESFSGAKWLNALFFVMLVLVMLLYDRTLVGMFVLYRRRIRTRIKK